MTVTFDADPDDRDEEEVDPPAEPVEGQIMTWEELEGEDENVKRRYAGDR